MCLFGPEGRILPEALQNTLKERFELHDVSGDGLISVDELGPLARSVGLNPTAMEVKAICSEYANSGGLAFVDFVFLYLRHCVELGNLDTTLGTFHLAFQYLDQNGSGAVDKSELKQVMEDCNDPITDEELDDIFQLVDEDNNGFISYEELYQAVADDLKSTLQGPLQMDDATRTQVREYIDSLQRSESERISKSPFALQSLVRSAYVMSNIRAFHNTVSSSMRRFMPFFFRSRRTMPVSRSSSQNRSMEEHQPAQTNHGNQSPTAHDNTASAKPSTPGDEQQDHHHTGKHHEHSAHSENDTFSSTREKEIGDEGNGAPQQSSYDQLHAQHEDKAKDEHSNAANQITFAQSFEAPQNRRELTRLDTPLDEEEKQDTSTQQE